jgi:hypothetical protein
MTRIGVSRRKALEAGACALAGAAAFPVTASARAGIGLSATNEEIIRKWYKAGEKGRGPIRCSNDRQLYLHQRGRRRPHQ